MSTTEHETTLGVDHRKLAMWVFLGSEFLFFGAFISTFLLYFKETNGGPGVELFDIAFTSISSFVLLMSSLTMVLAHNAHAHRDMRRVRLWLLATAGLGMVFIGGQAFEFTTFYKEGLTLSTSPMSSAFFVLTGLHGAHVTIGIVLLLSTYALTKTGKITPEQDIKTEMVGLYWHFVDIIWVLIFTVVYLIPYDTVVFGG
ncbi:MAG: heme/copper-type cytochrome/quinol oxidase subunit 3 [Nitriliruptoraceae bacterium]